MRGRFASGSGSPRRGGSGPGGQQYPVREAVIALEHQGIVEIRHHRGAFVNDFDRRSIADNYELWALLYGWAIRRAMESVTRLEEGVAVVGGRHPDVKRNDDVHPLMVRFADALVADLRFSGLASPSGRHTTPGTGGSFYTFVPGMRKSVARWIGRIAEAIEQDDGESAAAAAEEMLHEHGAGLISELERRGLIEVAAAATKPA